MLTELLQKPLQLVEAAGIAPTAAGGGPVDLDITALIYLVVFLVCWFVLKSLIFDPWLKVRDARAKGTEGNRAEADAMKSASDAKLIEYKAALSQARHDATDVRNHLKITADKREAEIVAAARAASQDKLSGHRDAIQAQVEGARTALNAEAERLGVAMADSLLPQ